MKQFFKVVCVVMLLSTEASSSGIPVSQKEKGYAEVLSQAFCESDLPEKDKMGKRTLDEVHTYAELKQDLRSSFPNSFTVCSTLMATNYQSSVEPLFFTILDNQLDQMLAANLRPSITSKMALMLSIGSPGQIHDKIPPTFPHEWVKSCVAVDEKSKTIDWVVDGNSVLRYENFTKMKHFPKTLSNKLILGANSYGGKWFAVSGKVTNLNIFSSSL